jgi:hypothetical protein
LALEALLYELTVNAEQVSTAGEKELFLFMSTSLGRGVRIMLCYNTRDGGASSNASEHFARLASALLIQAFCFDKDGCFSI